MGDDWGDGPTTGDEPTTTDYNSEETDYSAGGYGGGNRGGGGGRGASSGNECFRCRQTGHFSRECPNSTGSGKECRKCGQEGHFQKDCPQSSSGGGGGPRTCNLCGSEDHIKRDCPQNTGGGGSRACFKCGQDGHMSRECPNAAEGGTKGPMTCYKCHEEGHMSRDCPTGGAEGGGGGNRGSGCHRCGEEGHISRDCPKKGESGEGDVGPDGKPRERYTPAELGEGDAAFEELRTNHTGSGINFDQYEKIPVKVTGDNIPPPVQSFAEMKLRPLLLTNIEKCRYTKPTPIQRHATPILCNGRDIMACAQTGSGKSCAFLIPVLNNLMQDPNLTPPSTVPATPEALIMAPTRELALQIGKECNTYGQGSIVKTRIAYGGTTLFSQKNQLMSGCNILVATPGRLMQFINEGHIELKKIRFFILDEADRMLDMGFMADIQKIVELMPAKGSRISGMFSATFPDSVQKIATDFLENYIFVTIGIVGGACKDVEQTFVQVDRKEKRNQVLELLKNLEKDDKVLIFCGSKKGADFLATTLSTKQMSSTSIHGDRLQSQRETALAEFTRGTRQILVATAVAARGLDIPKVSLVINYDLPAEVEEYVHRIGRTGRVGNTGRAISFFDPESDTSIGGSLVRILKDAGQPVPDFMTNLSSGLGESDAYGGTDTRGDAEAGGEDDNDW